MAVNLGFYRQESLLLHSRRCSVILARLKNTPSQNHYFSEYLVVPGIVPEISGSVIRNSDHYPVILNTGKWLFIVLIYEVLKFLLLVN
jgi:hypothetical protein